MSTLTTRVRDWLVPSAPPLRLAVFRALVGAFATIYLGVRFRYLADFSRHAPEDFAPVGVCAVLGAPLPHLVTSSLVVVALGVGAAFTASRWLRVTGPALAFLLLWILSYASSWGKILHSENLLVLHVGVLAFAGRAKDARTAGWALRAAALATVLTYFVAGITKLRSGGAAWLSGEALGEWLAWDAVRKVELGSFYSPLAAYVAGSPVVLRALAIVTLVVEVGAPLALASSRIGRRWALLAWCFHLGILATMAIGFFYPLSGVALAPLFPLERLATLARRRR